MRLPRLLHSTMMRSGDLARSAGRIAGLALALLFGATAAQAMTFALVPVGMKANAIMAEGEIEADSAEKFVAFVARHIGSGRLHSVVFIHSPGGVVGGAMKLGMVLRDMGAAVVVGRPIPLTKGKGPMRMAPGRCMSACVYAMMGGKKRVVPPQSQMVLHRMYRIERGIDPARQEPARRRVFAGRDLVETLADYTARMGISPELVTAAETLKGESIRVLTPREIARWKLGVPRL